MAKTESALLAYVLAVLLFFICVGFPDGIQPNQNSEGYLSFAEDIRTGQILREGPAPWHSVINAPGYPIMIVVAQLLTGDNPSAILFLHMLLALLTIGLVVFRFRKLINPFILSILSVLIFWLWRDYYAVALAEWAALCSFLVFLSLVPLDYKECSAAKLFVLGLSLSALILIRPVLISCLIIIALIVFFVIRPEEKRKVSTGILLGLFPLFLCCLFNSYRLGIFTPAVFIGHNLFGVASLIGSAQFESDELPGLIRFSDYVNANKIPPSGLERAFVDRLPASYYSSSYGHNIYQVALRFESERNHPPGHYDALMARYARQVILDNIYSYLRFVAAGLRTMERDLWLMLVSLAMLLMLIRFGHPMSLVHGAALSSHFLNVALSSLIETVTASSYLLTLVPLGFVTLLSILTAIRPRNHNPSF